MIATGMTTPLVSNVNRVSMPPTTVMPQTMPPDTNSTQQLLEETNHMAYLLKHTAQHFEQQNALEEKKKQQALVQAQYVNALQAPRSASPPPSMPSTVNPEVAMANEITKQLYTQGNQWLATMSSAPPMMPTLPTSPTGVSSPSASGTPVSAVSGNTGGSGGYINPLPTGKFTSGFGPRGGRQHKGIDLAAPEGTPVVAAMGGEVITNGWDAGGYGHWLAIRHPNGDETRYGHFSEKSPLKVGDQVSQGTPIGKVGNTGRSTGPHLHFEIRKATQKPGGKTEMVAVDPKSHIKIG